MNNFLLCWYYINKNLCSKKKVNATAFKQYILVCKKNICLLQKTSRRVVLGNNVPSWRSQNQQGPCENKIKLRCCLHIQLGCWRIKNVPTFLSKLPNFCLFSLFHKHEPKWVVQMKITIKTDFKHSRLWGAKKMTNCFYLYLTWELENIQNISFKYSWKITISPLTSFCMHKILNFHVVL